MKTVKQLNVYRWCLGCGYERFEPEDVYIHDDGMLISQGFIKCPKCFGDRFTLGGYRDRRKSAKGVENEKR